MGPKIIQIIENPVPDHLVSFLLWHGPPQWSRGANMAPQDAAEVPPDGKIPAHSFPPSSLDRRSTEFIVSPKKGVGCKDGSRDVDR